MGFLKKLILFSLFLFFIACNKGINNEFEYIEISRENYTNKLYGFWLGQSIANWTGLITEMDKIGNLGEIKTGLKKYLKSVLGGIRWYLQNENSVPRNHFGKHKWFS
jgi:hypothetical protein